jgi:hypothetical protein
MLGRDNWVPSQSFNMKTASKTLLFFKTKRGTNSKNKVNFQFEYVCYFVN